MGIFFGVREHLNEGAISPEEDDMADGLSIKIVRENCRGCRRCQVACSWHDPGPINPRLAGIQIMKLDEGGCDYPIFNMECLERFCGKRHPRRKKGTEQKYPSI